MSEPKYKTLKELKKAFDSGDLDPESFEIRLDNDSCKVSCGFGKDEAVFFYRDFGGDVLIEEALDLLGIPWQNA